MKIKAIIMLLFLFCLPQTAFAVEADKPKSQPELKIIESTYAFQSITEGIDIIHDFAIKNTGDAQLDVLKVRPG